MTHISTLEGDYNSAEGQPDPHVLSKNQQEAEAISRQCPDLCSLVWGKKHITPLLLPILFRRRQAFPEVQETEIFGASTAECCGDCLLKQQSQECDFSTKT